MFCSGCSLFFFRHGIARMYTPEADVIGAGAALLIVAAVFQIFDGMQVVATGALRGTGNTRTAMLANLIGYWVIGLPLGAWLCFKLKLGAAGMWMGLCLSLMIIGVALAVVWRNTIRNMMVASAPEHNAHAVARNRSA
jgi:MATE family multidrug resistance protein